MKNFPSLFFLFLLTTNSQAQWLQVQNTPSFDYGSCIDAIGENFVVFASGNKILISKDAGKTWIQKSTPNRFVDISLVDENTFYAAADNGCFYKTTNGGTDWITAYYNPSKSMFANYIEMFSATEGIGMGDALYPSKVPLFIKTSDGINWIETCNQSIGGGASDGWLGVDFVNPNIGYYSPKGGPSPRNLHKTIDGGFTWIKTDFEVYANVLKFYDEEYGILAKWPSIYRTTTGGLNWSETKINVPNIVFIQDIEFVPNNPNQVWMSYDAEGGLFFSNDSGKTWSKPILPPITHAFDIKFISPTTGWLLSQTNSVFYTNNNGGVSTSSSIKSLPAKFSLEQNYPNPFNPATVISYQLPVSTHVTLKIYDLLGREIATLVDEFKNAGAYNSSFSALNPSLVSGTYFYRLTANNFSSAKKMILIK